MRVERTAGCYSDQMKYDRLQAMHRQFAARLRLALFTGSNVLPTRWLFVTIFRISCCGSSMHSLGNTESWDSDLTFLNNAMKNHCVKCHGGEVQKAGVRLDRVKWKKLPNMRGFFEKFEQIHSE